MTCECVLITRWRASDVMHFFRTRVLTTMDIIWWEGKKKTKKIVCEAMNKKKKKSNETSNRESEREITTM